MDCHLNVDGVTLHSWIQYSGVGDRDQLSWGLHLQSLDTWIHVGLSKGVDINTNYLSACYNQFTLQFDKHSFFFSKLHFQKERQTLPGLWLKPFSDVPMTLQTVQHLARRNVSLFWNVLFKNCRTSVIFLPSRPALLSWVSRHSSSTSWIPSQNITAETGLCFGLVLVFVLSWSSLIMTMIL